MTWKTFLALVTVLVPAAAAVVIAFRQGRSSDRTGMAAQFAAMTDRLSKVETRLEESEAREAKMVTQSNRQTRFIYVLIGVLDKHGIPTPPPPEGLEL